MKTARDLVEYLLTQPSEPYVEVKVNGGPTQKIAVRFIDNTVMVGGKWEAGIQLLDVNGVLTSNEVESIEFCVNDGGPPYSGTLDAEWEDENDVQWELKNYLGK